MKPISRQVLTALLKRFARTAIDNEDQTYGRQLATICEQVAASLRVKFGGHSLLLQTPKQRKAAATAPPRPLTPEERTARDIAAWNIVASSRDPYAVEVGVALRRLGIRDIEFIKYVPPIVKARKNGGVLRVGEIEIWAWGKIWCGAEDCDHSAFPCKYPTPTALVVSDRIAEIAREVAAEDPKPYVVDNIQTGVGESDRA